MRALWAKWENALASMANSGPGGDSTGGIRAGVCAAGKPLFRESRAFLPAEEHILRNMDKIAHIPGVIVQGRYDMICPPVSA